MEYLDAKGKSFQRKSQLRMKEEKMETKECSIKQKARMIHIKQVWLGGSLSSICIYSLNMNQM